MFDPKGINVLYSSKTTVFGTAKNLLCAMDNILERFAPQPHDVINIETIECLGTEEF
jgi:hypothetical protein